MPCYSAAVAGNVHSIRSILDSRAHVDTRDENQQTMSRPLLRLLAPSSRPHASVGCTLHATGATCSSPSCCCRPRQIPTLPLLAAALRCMWLQLSTTSTPCACCSNQARPLLSRLSPSSAVLNLFVAGARADALDDDGMLPHVFTCAPFLCQSGQYLNMRFLLDIPLRALA